MRSMEQEYISGIHFEGLTLDFYSQLTLSQDKEVMDRALTDFPGARLEAGFRHLTQRPETIQVPLMFRFFSEMLPYLLLGCMDTMTVS